VADAHHSQPNVRQPSLARLFGAFLSLGATAFGNRRWLPIYAGKSLSNASGWMMWMFHGLRSVNDPRATAMQVSPMWACDCGGGVCCREFHRV
jgi:hypothetical protein